MARLKRRYERIPKVFVVKENQPIDILCRLDKGGVAGWLIKEMASAHVDRTSKLYYLSGRVLSDFEMVESKQGNAIFTL